MILDDEFATTLETFTKERCSGLTKEVNNHQDANIKDIADHYLKPYPIISGITDQPIYTADIQ